MKKLAWNSNKTYLDDDRILSGDKHPRYHKGKNQSKYLIYFRLQRREMIKNETKCNNCDCKASLLHHLDKDTSNNTTENLLPLCNSCHTILHNKERGVTIYKHNCEFCNIEFTILSNKNCQQKYCSLHCKSKTHYLLGKTLPQNRKGGTLYKHNCPECNIEFINNRPNQKYCSNKCKFINLRLYHF